jgi:hypothetical protein
MISGETFRMTANKPTLTLAGGTGINSLIQDQSTLESGLSYDFNKGENNEI